MNAVPKSVAAADATPPLQPARRARTRPAALSEAAVQPAALAPAQAPRKAKAEAPAAKAEAPVKSDSTAKAAKPAKPAKLTSTKAAAEKAEKADKPKKPKLVRDSFTIPKPEYAALDDLKKRSATLGQPAKKSELLRAGLKALTAMGDDALRKALAAVPAIKTGRPAKD